jgi:hypothetical protein
MGATRTLSRDSAVGEQRSPARTVMLPLLPGPLITAFYIVAAPAVRGLGFPSLMAFFLAILFVLILCQSSGPSRVRSSATTTLRRL